MKITLFTSNNYRHNYFINLLSNFCDELYVIQECKALFKQNKNINLEQPSPVESYFEEVSRAQNKIFKKEFVNNKNKNIKIFSILYGELNNVSLPLIKDFLKSDIYIVFGSSYIKGDLIEFLVKQNAINIHAGVTPFYRGQDCNFWALYDGNPHLVGSTIHLLSKGLDSGAVLYHAMSNLKTNPYEYTMSTVKSAFYSICERIKDGSIYKFVPIPQDKNKEIRYSKKNEFTSKVIQEYFKKKINLKSKNFNNSLLKEPYFLN